MNIFLMLGSALCVLGFTQATLAEDVSRWELGAGFAVASLPHYRGSDQQYTYALPVPYIIYRGDTFKIDRQGMQGLFFENPRVLVDLSLAAAPPVRSKDNRARAGMNDLHPSFELGPSLVWKVWDNPAHQVRALFPMRGVVATNLSKWQSAGFLFAPRLSWGYQPSSISGLNVGASVGLSIATRKHHDYFYGVDESFAQVNRPEYQAKGGYSGSNALLFVNRKQGRWRYGAFLRWDNVQSTAFEGSPLVKQKNNWSVGLGVSWVFSQSKENTTLSSE